MEYEVCTPGDQLAATIAVAMIFRQAKNSTAAQSRLQEACAQLDKQLLVISDELFLRICAESFAQNELARVAPRLARWSSRPDLPSSTRARLDALFGASVTASGGAERVSVS